MKIRAYLVKSFTKDKNQGNPAGVILDADELTEQQMIAISSKLGFSESVFIQKSENTNFKTRFFSPTHEVDLCGHATIAAFHTLIEGGKVHFGGLKNIALTQETKAGIFPVTCYKDGLIVMTQDAPKYSDFKPNKKKIAELLNISERDILDHPLEIISTGTPKLIIPVRSLEVLLRIKPDLEGIKKFCILSGAKGFYPFTSETKDTDSNFHARQFNPLAGIDEDPITGVAAGALGAYIKKHKLLNKDRFIVEQGYIMNKTGKIFVNTTNGIEVGGYAVSFGTKEIVL